MEPTDTLSGNELIPRWTEPAGLKPILAQAVLTSLEEFILQELAKGRDWISTLSPSIQGFLAHFQAAIPTPSRTDSSCAAR